MRLTGFIRHLLPAWAPRTLGLTATFGSLMLAPGCMNFKIPTGLSQSTREATTDTGSTGGNEPITLVRALKSTVAPNSLLDLIGDGSNQIGDYCVGVGTDSTCKCRYRFTRSGNEEELLVDPTYTEGNLLRCSYGEIPSGVTSVQVSIKIVSSSSYSNEDTFTFSGSGVTVDPTAPASFVQVKRYQCHDLLYIPGMIDGVLSSGGSGSATGRYYDPMQSIDTRIAYALNFFATDLGSALSHYADITAKEGRDSTNPGAPITDSWECSVDPLNPKYWENPYVFSEGPDTNGSKLIYPPGGSAFDRYTFYLAKQPTGVFSVAFNVRVGPPGPASPAGQYTQTPQGGAASSNRLPPIGYAARPILSSTGESCPTDPIPAGYHWVKVWAFRGDLNPRNYVAGSTDLNQKIGVVGCDAGFMSREYANRSPAGTKRFINTFPDCSVRPASSGQSFTVSGGWAPSRGLDMDLRTDVDLATRGWLGSQFACVDFALDPELPLANFNDFYKSAVGRQVIMANNTGYPLKGVPGTWGYVSSTGAQYEASLSSSVIKQADAYIRVGRGVIPDLVNAPTDTNGDELFSIIRMNLSNRLMGTLGAMPFALNALPTGNDPDGSVDYNNLVDPVILTDLTGAEIADYTSFSGQAMTFAAGTLASSHSPVSAPYDSQLQTATLDPAGSRADFMFVVTPTSVMKQTMINKTSGYQPYYPYTFKTKEECPDPDPDSSATCLQSFARKTTFDLYLPEVTGDTGGQNPNDQYFPLCALQPD